MTTTPENKRGGSLGSATFIAIIVVCVILAIAMAVVVIIVSM
jgi:flagellar basal body-associated protein FliL